MTETAIAPSSHLMDLILSVLAPLLTTGAITDIRLARRAALETIAAYNAQGQDELVTIGQILTFALTAVDNLRLSMAPDLSLTMKLKLRSSANALNRSALHSTQALEKARHPKPLPAPRLAKPAAAPLSEPAHDPAQPQATAQHAKPQPITAQPPKPQPAQAHLDQAQPASQRQAANQQVNRLHWAVAMKNQAANLRATDGNITPAQQRTNTLWAEVLTEVADELATTTTAKPASSRAELMRTTLMASDPGFPVHLLHRGPRK